jgi:NADH-quinone oxidoreductase subunit L
VLFRSIGALSLAAIPPFSGFYSKDSIIEAVHASTMAGSGYAYVCLILGVFVTALYTFRAFFMTFHGKPRIGEDVRRHLKETPWVMTLPQVVLAIPAVILGVLLVHVLLYSDTSWFGETLFVLPVHNVLARLAPEFHGAWDMAWHAFLTLPFYVSVLGIIVAWLFTMMFPAWSITLKKYLSFLYQIIIEKYGFDAFNQRVIVQGTARAARFFYERGDEQCVDRTLVEGSGGFVRWLSSVSRGVQTGYLYHYALAMVVGLVIFLCLFILG